MMRLTRTALPLIPILAIGCAGGGTRQSQPPAPQPAREEPVLRSPSASSWVFSYAPGVESYRVTRSATVEDVSDQTHREVTTNLTHERLGLERVGDTIQFTVVVDTFTTTTQNLLGAAQASPLPIRLGGILVHDTLQISADSATASCSPSQSAIRSDIHNLIIPFPDRLEQGMVWTDSLELAGCQAMIPTTARIRRSFRVSGETSYDGRSVVLIQRRDSIQAHGEGAQGQHRLILDAVGSGSVLYYVSPSSGQILNATAEQSLSLAITASDRTSSFRQNLKQEFSLVR